MANPRNKFHSKNSFFLSLAFEQAKKNLGSTKENPSVGCIVEKNDSVLSSGYTSFNGRPHAEFNALNKKKISRDSNLYITLEPCSHYGLTPPCTNIIINKKIKKVFYSINDIDDRSSNKSQKILKKHNIKVKSNILKKVGKEFYRSYFSMRSNSLPVVDAKLAVSKDFYTKNRKKKWITNYFSRRRAHLLRSQYDCILTTSKTLNEDNPLLNCRIEGLEKKSPSICIIDRKFKIKRKINLLKIKRKVYLFTSVTDKKKERFFINKGFKIIKVKSMKNSPNYSKIFQKLSKLGFSRILVESGPNFLTFLIKNKFLSSLYLFKSKETLGKNGLILFKKKLINIFKYSQKEINVNLFNDKLYKINLNTHV